MRRILTAAMIVSLTAVSGALGQGKNPVVLMDTSYGKIKIELFAKKAPISVKNFLKYVEDKHYDGTVFHRVISDFMVQGGGFSTDYKEKKTRPPIKNESYNGLSNKRGAIAMARTNVPDSATAQFYINVKDNDFLDKAKARDKVGYAVFGQVIDGMDVVDEIRRVETNAADRPLRNVLIRSVKVVKSAK